LFVESFEEFAAFEAHTGADEGDEFGGVDRAPAVLGGLDELEPHRQAGRS
jgi:integrase/recombinase XerD